MTNQELWDIVGEKRFGMTATEFLAQVEAHRVARLKEKQLPRKALEPGPFAREYVLNPDLKYTPRMKGAVTPKPEVTP